VSPPNSKLKSATHNPDDWITDLEFLRTQINNVTILGKTDMTEVDLIIHILSNLLEEYEVVVSKIEEKLKISPSALQLEDVRVDCYSTEKGLSSTTFEALSELDKTALAAFIKQFKGLCNKCGKYGHKSADCKTNNNKDDNHNNKSGGNNNIKCFYCGKFGHKKVDCRKRKADIAKRDNENAAKFAAGEPSDDSDSEASDSEEKSTTKLGFTAHQTNKLASTMKFETILKGEEVQKCTIQGNTYPSFTENTCYRDSGASCHITNDDGDIYDIKNINKLIGGIGPDVIEKVLYPCKYSKDASDNLYSITSEQNIGARLSSDDKNNILLHYPDGSTVSFDQQLKTKDGWVAGVDIFTLAKSCKAEEMRGKRIRKDPKRDN
jgi:hypothetical protein